LLVFWFLASVNSALKERRNPVEICITRQNRIDRFCRKTHVAF